jgi:SAM-dependent methyltransferase
MDCDFTHQPADVKRLYEQSKDKDHDVTVASRYLEKDSLPNWNFYRRFLTHLGHFLTVNLLHLPQDATGALRVYHLRRIPRELFGLVRSQGYSFFFESLFVLHQNGFSIHEFPISLPARTYGHSKMTWYETYRSAKLIIELFLSNATRPEQFLLPKPIDKATELLHDPQGWDAYWSKSTKKSRILYTFIASIYRRLIIKRRLNYFIFKHFSPGSRLLHAGSGSGQVDLDITKSMRITALDISLPALQRYRRNNPWAESVKHGDILKLDFAAETFDGVYNLGVLEHFSSDQISSILLEMHRVLKPEGKIVIFWPHRFASSVWVLKYLHLILNWNGRTPVQLHPPEISLLPSKHHAGAIIEQASFKLIDYYFGFKDFFVQAVIIGQKAKR